VASTTDVPDVHRRLVEIFGQHTWQPDLDPLDEAIGTIISQHTSAANSRRAFDRLRAEFGTWEAVRHAPVDAIAGAIWCAGLARQKAPRIKALLERVSAERGRLDLAFLAQLPPGAAMAWLRRLPGVGQTTAACVLLFGLGRPVMPVDGGILRIARRIGLVGERGAPDAVQAALEGAVPPEWVYCLHVNLIRFGRDFCTPSAPACPICPLNDLCDYFRRSHDDGSGVATAARGAGRGSNR
jgi:endonuclease-3